MKYQSRFWRRYFRYYDVLLKVIPYQNVLKELASFAKTSSVRLLDLGAGTGNLLYHLPSDVQVTSLDNSEEALERLLQKFPDAQIIRHSIIEPLPFNDNYFDGVISNNVLYTLQEKQWEPLIEEIKRVCRPNGFVAVSNLAENFDAMSIYKAHINQSLKLKGRLRTVIELTQLIWPTFKIFWFNKKIKKDNAEGIYSFVKEDHQKQLFEKYGFQSLFDTKWVYAEQAKLNGFVNIK